MPYAEFSSRLVLAALLGGAVGLEREIQGRPAGIPRLAVTQTGKR